MNLVYFRNSVLKIDFLMSTLKTFSSNWKFKSSYKIVGTIWKYIYELTWFMRENLISKWQIGKEIPILFSATIFWIYRPLYAPGKEFGGICFLSCLSVGDSVICGKKTFNLGHNFWTLRNTSFIFGMHTQLMKPFQMTPRSMALWPWPWLWPLY